MRCFIEEFMRLMKMVLRRSLVEAGWNELGSIVE